MLPDVRRDGGQIADQAAEPVQPQPNVSAGRANHHPFDQRPHNPRLLRREQPLRHWSSRHRRCNATVAAAIASCGIMHPVQPSLFEPIPSLPEGFRYKPNLISPLDEGALVEKLGELPFTEFEFKGYVGKRRTVSFGWTYDFSQEKLQVAEDIPVFLLPLRRSVAAFADLDAAALQQVLVTEYGPGAPIGWHKDKAIFEEVAGVSLSSPCVFRLRRKEGSGWRRASLILEPRSAYLLAGPARTVWEHSIPAVGSLRYSVTFRTVRSE